MSSIVLVRYLERWSHCRRDPTFEVHLLLWGSGGLRRRTVSCWTTNTFYYSGHQTIWSLLHSTLVLPSYLFRTVPSWSVSSTVDSVRNFTNPPKMLRIFPSSSSIRFSCHTCFSSASRVLYRLLFTLPYTYSNSLPSLFLTILSNFRKIYAKMRRTLTEVLRFNVVLETLWTIFMSKDTTWGLDDLTLKVSTPSP